ncbi:unnamed protein product [Cylicocyclus nassatus]|uniref:Uncharacterized protein n=1 Tax=Cylicocyclus nassatus TaxID=53992 RepID=A0AA36HBS9_CYLNA|nr:unnamed protein product [Cylicocyclus nassatus]
MVIQFPNVCHSVIRSYGVTLFIALALLAYSAVIVMIVNDKLPTFVIPNESMSTLSLLCWNVCDTEDEQFDRIYRLCIDLGFEMNTDLCSATTYTTAERTTRRRKKFATKNH